MLELICGDSGRDYICYSTKEYTAIAYLDKGSKICTHAEKNEETKVTNKNKLMSLWKSGFTKYFLMITLLKILIIYPLVYFKIISKLLVFLPMLVHCVCLIIAIIVVRKQELLRNHGAEHMVATAYKKLGYIPEISEAMQYSRISPDCGINLWSCLIFCELVSAIVYLWFTVKIPEIFIIESLVVLRSYAPFNLIGMLGQLFTTKKPKRHNVKLAIKALKALNEISIRGR